MRDRADLLGDKVVYQIYIKSFNDSNGDGIGDLRGITERLDYLVKLGVDYIWINPFFLSPQKDNGYDIADYLEVDPMFGTMGDFDELAHEATKRGIGIMVDMVLNHTSTSHEWFKRALEGDPKYLDYYKFVDAAPGATAEDPGEPPTNWESQFGGSAWEYVPELNKWYLHLFDRTQADLNWDNPEVRAELAKVVRFWKGRGVSGFRFDVVNLISKPDELYNVKGGSGRHLYDGPHVHEYLQELVRECGIEDMVTVGEMGSTSIDQCVLYTAPEQHELTQVFSFYHVEADYPGGEKWMHAELDVSKLRGLLRDWQEQMTAKGGWNALFWSNHDQPRPNSRFGDVSSIESWRRSSELLPTCSHLMRGTPYIFQGEELGMLNPDFTSIEQFRDVESINYYRILQERGISPSEAFGIICERSRDNSHTPMRWDRSRNCGFTDGTPWIDAPSRYDFINAEDEVGDPDSVFSYFQRLIEIRKSLPIVQRGGIVFLDSASGKVIAYKRTLDSPDSGPSRIVVACNLSNEDATALPSSEVDGGDLLICNCKDWRLDGDSLVLGPWAAVAFSW